MTVDDLGPVLLAGAIVLLTAVVAVRVSTRSGLPSLLVYLGLGLLISYPDTAPRLDDAALTGFLGYAALFLILAEGGLSTEWSSIRPAVLPAALLATLGTGVSVAVTGAVARWLLGLDWNTAMILGAAVSTTDAAAVFSVLRRVPLPRRLVGILEAESGFNDAPAVLIVVAFTERATGEQGHGWGWLLLLAGSELLIGGFVGVLVGWFGSVGLRRVALPSSGLYPAAVLGLVGAAYGLASTLHGSGFLATYVCSLVLGSVRLPHRAAVRGFAEGMGWIAQIGLFVLLGVVVEPSRLPQRLPEAVAMGLVLLVLARPLSVLVGVGPFRVSLHEQLFLSWAGLRGAVPIVLATVPWAARVEGSQEIFDLVFVLVVVFTLVQGPTLPWVARRLGVGSDLPATALDLESSPLGTLDADVICVRVGPGSRLHGIELFELRLPDRANVTLVVRDGDAFVPTPWTVLRHDDELLVVVVSSVRRTTVDRLVAVSDGGKLADWYASVPSPRTCSPCCGSGRSSVPRSGPWRSVPWRAGRWRAGRWGIRSGRA